MSQHSDREHPEIPAAEAAVELEETLKPGVETGEEAAPRGGHRWRRWMAGAAVLAVLAVAGAVALTGPDAKGEETATAAADDEADGTRDGREEKDGDEKPPVPVELATVERGEVASYLTATTNLVAEGEVMVLAEVEGRVERVAADEGGYVEKGQILAILARQDAEIALQKARVREENAKTVHSRGLELAKDELISAEDRDKRRLDFELAQQERQEAEWRLAKTEIRAPISGRVSLRSTQVGQHVRPGDELFQITDFDPLIARIYLSEKDVLDLTTGRRVEMSLDAAPDVAFHGRIQRIAPVVDTATGTVKVTLEAQNPPPAVRPGSFVTVKVVRERRPDAVVLPKNAVLRELKQAHVFVAEGDGDDLRAVRRAVTLGLEEGERVEVLDGVEPGERLVVAGQGSLADGARIRTLPGAADANADLAADAADAAQEG